MMQPEKEFEVFWEKERLEWPASMAENPMLKDAVYAGWKAGKSTNDDTSHAEASKQWTCEDQQAGKLPEAGSLVMTVFTEHQEARFLGRTLIDDGSWRWVVCYSNGLCGLKLPEHCSPVGGMANPTVSDRDFADLVNGLKSPLNDYKDKLNELNIYRRDESEQPYSVDDSAKSADLLIKRIEG